MNSRKGWRFRALPLLLFALALVAVLPLPFVASDAQGNAYDAGAPQPEGPVAPNPHSSATLHFEKPYATYVFYAGVAADQNLPTASSTSTGAITYSISPTPTNGITFTAATPKLSASTSTAKASAVTYTLTATQGGSTATIKIVVGVISDVCSSKVSTWKPTNITPGAGLIRDCNILLAVKSTLEGTTGNLDWSTGSMMLNWDGIDSDPTSQRGRRGVVGLAQE